MFQYLCRSPIIRLHFMHAAPTAVKECRLLPTFYLLLPSSADFQSTTADYCLLLPSSTDFRLLVPTESLFTLYIGTVWCYMYSSMKRRVNAKRLPPLPGQTSRGRPRKKSRTYSISSSRDRSGA